MKHYFKKFALALLLTPLAGGAIADDAGCQSGQLLMRQLAESVPELDPANMIGFGLNVSMVTNMSMVEAKAMEREGWTESDLAPARALQGIKTLDADGTPRPDADMQAFAYEQSQALATVMADKCPDTKIPEVTLTGNGS